MNLTDVLPVTHNARGLGGLPTERGERIAPVLFRADALAGLTDAGLAGLAELGIGTVVDLRTEHERARSADSLPEDGSVEFIALPVLGGAMDEMAKSLMPAEGLSSGAGIDPERIAALLDTVPTLDELYLSILASSPAQFATLARAVVDAAGTDRPGVLFHCTAGKDRTGLAAALLLAVAGVPRETIVADYALTEHNLAGPFAQTLLGYISATGIPLTPKLEELATKSPASAISAALDWVEREHGDAGTYLRSGGLSADELLRLRSALVAPVA